MQCDSVLRAVQHVLCALCEKKQAREFFSSSGPKDPMSLCRGVSSVRPSFRPSTVFKMLLLRHFSTDFDSDCFIR